MLNCILIILIKCFHGNKLSLLTVRCLLKVLIMMSLHCMLIVLHDTSASSAA